MWVCSLKGKTLGTVVRKLAWAATIYHLWRQRNARIQENQYLGQGYIIDLICIDVRLKAASFSEFVDNPSNRSYCDRWKISYSILKNL